MDTLQSEIHDFFTSRLDLAAAHAPTPTAAAALRMCARNPPRLQSIPATACHAGVQGMVLPHRDVPSDVGWSLLLWLQVISFHCITVQ